MKNDWPVEKILEYARDLKSPFEEINKGVIPTMVDKIKSIATRNKEVKPL